MMGLNPAPRTKMWYVSDTVWRETNFTAVYYSAVAGPVGPNMDHSPPDITILYIVTKGDHNGHGGSSISMLGDRHAGRYIKGKHVWGTVDDRFKAARAYIAKPPVKLIPGPSSGPGANRRYA